MLIRGQDKGALRGSAALLPRMKVCLQRLHPMSPVSITPGLSPPHFCEQRLFQLSARASESAGALVISLSSHASSLKSVRLNNEGTGDPREEENPRWATFQRRDAARGREAAHPADALLSHAPGHRWACVIGMCHFPRVTQALTN